MLPRVRNWVFLGDSLNEGVGSKRISHVAELVKQLRSSGCAVAAGAKVHEFRLRHVDSAFNQQIDFNVGGLIDGDFFYRDGFHPNEAGADALAGILRERLCQQRIL